MAGNLLRRQSPQTPAAAAAAARPLSIPGNRASNRTDYRFRARQAPAHAPYNDVADYTIPAHAGIALTVRYTSKATIVEDCIDRFYELLDKEQHRIVGLDVKFTRAKRGKQKNLPDHMRQKAAVIQLCVGTYCLVYQMCHADRLSPKFCDFLLDESIEFVGVGITQDTEILARCQLQVAKHVDIQKIYKVPNNGKEIDSLCDLAEHLIDPWYKDTKHGVDHRFHNHWEKPLSEDHVRHASLDAYASYEIYRQLRNRREAQADDPAGKGKMEFDEGSSGQPSKPMWLPGLP
ncbi:uncharacterized protein LOC104582011 [Brachypodium distachyon]|uniref:3'-5' exonuclease domain-containing protein n=1 Tax=Brachypodium distachyon TaxID=15368 RepID=A0A0Q3RNQ9_BRADI|nr:uncharacterized protein LOC104582011 [Brachypodium distachyon]KQK14634.1 hypothetical protein BRADI_1g17712v3 [Brachypodium distachyon]|eukprot:XP_010229563.1 uncharacterized protein LOC104582011 [Brachypodium distachyon]